MKKIIILISIFFLMIACSLPVVLPEVVGTLDDQWQYNREDIEPIYKIADNVVVYPYLPPDYDPTNAQGYSALFILDGDSHFELATAYYSELLETDECDPLLIFGVGYGYPDAYSGGGRFRDYAGPDYPSIWDGSIDNSNVNSDNFYKFMIEKVVPDAKKNYSINDDEIALFGHSLGGAFTYYAFQTFDRSGIDNYTSSPFSYFCVGDQGTTIGDLKRLDAFLQAPETKISVSNPRKISLYFLYGPLVNLTSIIILESMIADLNTKNYPDLSVNRFYPLNEDHAQTMHSYIKNGLRIISNASGGFKKYGDDGGYILTEVQQ